MPADPSPDDKGNVSEEPTVGDDEWPVPPSGEDIVQRLPEERGSIAFEGPAHSRISAAARVAALLTALVVLVLLGAGGAWLVAGLDDPSASGSASPSPAPGGTTAPPDTTEPSSAGQTTESTTTAPETTTAGETPTERASVVTTPEVVGLRVGRAIQRLRAVGLRATTSTVVSERAPGTVVGQRPTAGDRLERGSAVRIQVARAKPVQTVRVPQLVGLTVSEAKRRLGQVGMRWSVVTVTSDSAEGTVLGQSPTSGAEVRKATTITLRVSSGPASISVPDVVGDSEASARATLQSAGFDVTVVEEPTEDPAADGVVTAQDPPAGKQLRERSPVTITVGRFTPPPTTG